MIAKILAFAGSTREQSFNKKLVKIAAGGAKKSGGEVTYIDLRDYPMPLFDQDLEAKEGMPENARKIKELMITHDGFLVASPEYNSSITPLLKNTIDWASRRTTPMEPPLAAFTGKIAAVMSASPGNLGGLRSLVVTRAILQNMGVLVIPNQKAIVRADQAFGSSGTLKDKRLNQEIEKLGQELVSIIQRLNRAKVPQHGRGVFTHPR